MIIGEGGVWVIIFFIGIKDKYVLKYDWIRDKLERIIMYFLYVNR